MIIRGRQIETSVVLAKVRRPHSFAAAVIGLATVVTIACSGAFDPTTGTAIIPIQQSPADGPALTPQQSGTTERLQAVSPVNEQVVWASGLGGTFTRTRNGGQTWEAGVVPGAEALQFRDVEGVSDKVAYLLAAGTGADSRIYQTTDGGRTWALQFQNQEPRAFYDCFDFWNSDRGLTFADPVEGHFTGVRTFDGKSWRALPDQPGLDLAGEAGFAASGTCIATQGDRLAWVGTGGSRARILGTTDGGGTWTPYDTPLAGGEGAGVFTVAFRDRLHGVLGGGNFNATEVITNFARSTDGGRTWEASATPAPIPGAIFGLAYVPGRRDQTVVVTGPGGTAWSADEGRSWFSLPDVTGYWAVAFAGGEAGWVVGTEGRILKISFDRPGSDQ
jgi:photosystem II stability/assembly factor-like uncharacterized protein